MTKKPENLKLLEIKVEGMIGESSPFFRLPIGHQVEEIHLDMAEATYMNSVGVKNWVLWATKIPSKVKVLLKNCPAMIASQASAVVGFLPQGFFIESFYAPFVCPECDAETSVLLKWKEHFDYKSGEIEPWVKLPKLQCVKCADKPTLEADFFESKMFGFLKMKS